MPIHSPHHHPPRISIYASRTNIFRFPTTTRSPFLILLISMALFLSLLLILPISLSLSHHHDRPSASPRAPQPPSPAITQACAATRFPGACHASLSQSTDLPPSSSPTPLQILQAAFRASAQNLNTAQSMVNSILSSSHNTNLTNAATICLDVLTYSQSRTASAVSFLWRGRNKDARAWASAALAYQYDCWSGLKYVNVTQDVNRTMSFFDTTLIVSTSNALSMAAAFDIYGNDTRSWAPPKTERDGFWEPVAAAQGLEGRFPYVLAVNATVCKSDGGSSTGDDCSYETVQAAVAAAPSGLKGKERFVIYIKEGVYEEAVRVPFEKTNLVFLGDGTGKTVITGSLNTGILGITTYNTATVGVLGDGFMAYGLTIENTAGPDAHQAVAFRSDSDQSYIENCEFLGNQDTLYAHTLRQLYRSCRILGNVDFIFGNSAAVFQNCTILVSPRQVNPEKGETNAVTAHGRTDPAMSSGFVFLGCVINGTEDYMRLYYSNPKVHKNYLGRPWKQYSRTVFIESVLGDLVSPDGWLPWSGDFALSTLYYGEAGNTGPGANLSRRVPWSSQIPADHIYAYSVQNFIQGDEWITALSGQPLVIV